MGGGCNGILMRVRKLKEIKILFESRWYNIRYYTLLSPNFEQRFRVDWEWVVDQQMSGISWRTKVWRISFLLGLLEARTIRLSFSFLNAGVRRAWSSICRDIVRVRKHRPMSVCNCLFQLQVQALTSFMWTSTRISWISRSLTCLVRVSTLNFSGQCVSEHRYPTYRPSFVSKRRSLHIVKTASRSLRDYPGDRETPEEMCNQVYRNEHAHHL